MVEQKEFRNYGYKQHEIRQPGEISMGGAAPTATDFQAAPAALTQAVTLTTKTAYAATTPPSETSRHS